MTRLLYAGIDNGLLGGVVVLDEAGRLIRAHRTPTLKSGTKHRYDEAAMAELLDGITFLALEESRPIPRFRENGGGKREPISAGAATAHRQGEGYGLWRGMAAALWIPRLIVPPKDWQRSILRGLPTGRDEIKASAMVRARELWPDLPIPAGAGAGGVWQGVADAACLAEHGRRVRIGQSFAERTQ